MISEAVVALMYELGFDLCQLCIGKGWYLTKLVDGRLHYVFVVIDGITIMYNGWSVSIDDPESVDKLQTLNNYLQPMTGNIKNYGVYSRLHGLKKKNDEPDNSGDVL